MSLPTAYLTSRKRLPEMFEAIASAQAPEKFTQKFLETLEFKAKGDRLVINLLKSLGFLDDSGKPTNRYYEFLDQTQSGKVLADAIREAYSDLFAVNVNAHQLTKAELLGKLRTLSQGSYSDSVLNHMTDTFLALVKQADFTSHKKRTPTPKNSEAEATNQKSSAPTQESSALNLGGLVYNIQIVLPETRDQAVYDALFKSLKQHLK